MTNFSSEQVKEKVVSVLKNYIDPSNKEKEFSMEASLDELGLDSFKAIYLLLDMEEEFQIQIPDSMLSPEIFASPKALQTAIESILAG
ncbi:MAG TPA: phosphopantetheine-binding protein [Pseudobacteroides sp.]|uniref:phosphopantetheine-binding protein n=1 Tax=Pseudobacteroides sp. TaxID=1968840 RepID=UPI002F93B12B